MNAKLLSLLSLLFFTSCFNIAGKSGLKGNSKIVSQELNISDYLNIEAGSVVKIIYEQNPTKAPYLKYEIDENLTEYVSIKNEGQTLIIKSTKSINTNNFKVYTNSKQLSHADLSGASTMQINSELKGTQLEFSTSGASDLVAKNKIAVNELSAKASGASNITVSQIETNSVNISASASSDVKFQGATDTLLIRASGASDVTADKLLSRIANVEASGSSDVHLFVREELKATGSGSSDIRYKGSPKLKSISTSGSSDIKEK